MNQVQELQGIGELQSAPRSPHRRRLIDPSCLQALASRPDGRTATVEEFADALTRWLDRSAAAEEPAVRYRLPIALLCLFSGLAAAAALVWVGMQG